MKNKEKYASKEKEKAKKLKKKKKMQKQCMNSAQLIYRGYINKKYQFLTLSRTNKQYSP